MKASLVAGKGIGRPRRTVANFSSSRVRIANSLVVGIWEFIIENMKVQILRKRHGGMYALSTLKSVFASYLGVAVGPFQTCPMT